MKKTTIGKAPYYDEDSHLNYMGGKRQRNVALKKRGSIFDGDERIKKN